MPNQELENKIQELENKIQVLKEEFKIKIEELKSLLYSHQHTGYDRTEKTKKIFFIKEHLQGTQAATATNYGVFFIASLPCMVLEIKEVHGTAGTDAGDVTLDIERLQGTEALGSGDELISGAFSLKASIDTARIATLEKTNVVNLNIGDRLALKDTGVLTTVADVVVVVKLQLK